MDKVEVDKVVPEGGRLNIVHGHYCGDCGLAACRTTINGMQMLICGGCFKYLNEKRCFGDAAIGIVDAIIVEKVARSMCKDGRDADDADGGPHPMGMWLDKGEPWWTGYCDPALAAIAVLGLEVKNG